MSASERYSFTAAVTAARAVGAERTMRERYRLDPTRGTGEAVDNPDERKGLQHTLNNPLAALLAELQLLEMEELSEAHREAVERAIGLCRRVIVIVRERIPPSQV